MSARTFFHLLVIIVVNISILVKFSQAHDLNHKGYIIYCPCMGRFGNQAEQLLGSLYFAKATNRTLVLPPFIYYGPQDIPKLIPFDEIIQVEPLKSYHDVILLADFMERVAPKQWPQDDRKFYCPRPRDPERYSCAVLDGQPFKTFWSGVNVTRYLSLLYKPLTTKASDADGWSLDYPIKHHPVLAFVGAPSSFPTDQNSIAVQKFVHLSYEIQFKSEVFKLTNGLKKPYLSIHIRHGLDWERACDNLLKGDKTQFFSSNQCTGYNSTRPIEHKTCLPSFEMMALTLEKTLRNYEKTLVIRTVHIATDFNDEKLWQKFKGRFPQIKFIMNPEAFHDIMGAMIDIYLMTHADIFIGNCISSFSAFPARIRSEQLGLKHKTLYIGQSFAPETDQLSSHRNEL